MNIVTRLSRLYSPIHDCFAAIDAARVTATITGEPHTLYLDRTADRLRWYVRSVVDRHLDRWEWTGGIYQPGEARSSISCNPELTPELAEERGVSPYIHLDTLAAEYRRRTPMFENASHTPGPWTATGWENCIVNAADGSTIVACPGAGPGATLDEIKANARLIAAAPDLLAALQDLIDEDDHYGGCPESSPAWDTARKAVQRAVFTPYPSNPI